MNKAELIYFLEKIKEHLVCEEDREYLEMWIGRLDRLAWVEVLQKLG